MWFDDDDDDDDDDDNDRSLVSGSPSLSPVIHH